MNIFQISWVRKLQYGLLTLSTLMLASSSINTQSANSVLPPGSVEVTFPSGKLMLHGYIHKPHGNGPFPAIIINHGSEQTPKSGLKIAEPFTRRGYVVFFPHRRGQGRSSDRGEYIMDLIRREPGSSLGKKFVELQEIHQQDVIAALAYLKQLSYVDSDRIAMTGCSFGGIQTVLASEKKLGLRATVAFSPAAMSWAIVPELQTRMIDAVGAATVPILLIQAENDYDLSPTRAMAQALTQAQKPHKLSIYPAFGKTHAEGHGFCAFGEKIWGDEVFSFLDTAMK